MDMPKVTAEQKAEFRKFWGDHMETLRTDTTIRFEVISYLSMLVQADNVGFDQGEVRPGELGQWDVYYELQEIFSKEERLLASGLSAGKIAQAERRDHLEHTCCIDPDNPLEVAMIERLDAMSSSELDAEIARLESTLAA